jgi:DNA-binding IclR family transcriptional regulator
VQRIVKALSDEQLLMPGTVKARVKLGPLLVRLGASAKLDMVEIARPFMLDLARVLDETVDLSVLNGTTALFVEHVVGTQRLAAVSAIGTEFPLHSTANGKALLAAVSPARRMALLRGALGPPSAIRQLEQELLTAQATGIAYDRDEHTLGISAIGTWFSDAVGRPFALSIPVPSVRFGTGKHLIKPMIKTRDLIVEHLGRASGSV